MVIPMADPLVKVSETCGRKAILHNKDMALHKVKGLAQDRYLLQGMVDLLSRMVTHPLDMIKIVDSMLQVPPHHLSMVALVRFQGA